MTQSFSYDDPTPDDLFNDPDIVEIYKYLREVRSRTGFGKIVLLVHKSNLEDVELTIFKKARLQKQNGDQYDKLARRG